MDFAIVSAMAQAASGKPAVAKEALKRVIAETTKAGFIEYELEAQLALAKLGTKPGQNVDDRAGLDKVERDAKARGFDLIARKAAAARGA